MKNLLINQIKHSLTYYEETVPSSDADRLYFLKQHKTSKEMVITIIGLVLILVAASVTVFIK